MGDSAAAAEQYRKQSRDDDQKISNWGLFAETTWFMHDDQRLIGGIQHDQTRGHYYAGGKGADMMADNGINGPRIRHYALTSGFFRLGTGYR